MSKRIKGITIEIDGSTKGLDKALKDVNKESRDLQRELKDVERLLKFSPKNTELLAQKQKLLADQVKVTRERLDKLKSAQEQVTKAFENGEISEKQYRDFQKEIVETESKLKHYESQLKNVDSTQRSFAEKIAASGKTVKEFGEGMTTVGKELSMKVTAPLTAIGGLAVKLGADFRAGLSEVQAISGATAEDMLKLEESARSLGSTTKFSAKQVTEGFAYMSMSGWDVQQSLDGIDGVLNLAAASGEDLGRVADILTNSISSFGDEAKDAGRYADVLAAAASNANTDVSGLGEAFKMVAPVAGALGYSLEDTSVALGLMANSGIQGSQAGTALRSALTNLVSPTKAMKDEMEKLGINVKDSSGEMKPLDVLLKDLRGSFGKLTEAEKASAAATIFGKEAMSGMLAIVNAGESDFNKLSKAIADSEGVAESMSKTMQNNLAGQITNLKSGLEELALKISDALEPVMKRIVSAVQDLVNWLNGLDKETQLMIVSVAALAAAIGPLAIALGTILTMVGGFMTMLPTLIPLISALAVPIGIVVASLTALGIAYALLKTDADEAYKSQEKMAESNLALSESYLETLEGTTEQIDKTGELIAKTKEQMEVTDGLVDSFENLMNKSKLTTEEFGEFLTLQTQIENTKSPERIAELEERMNALREKSGLSNEEFNKLLESNGLLAEQFPAAGKVIDEYGNIIMDTTGKLRDMTNAELERMQVQVYNEMVEGLQEVNKEMDNYQHLIYETLELKEITAELEAEIRDIQNEVKNNESEIAENTAKILEIKELQKDASLKEYYNLEAQKNELQGQNYVLEEQNKKHNKNLDVLESTLSTEEKDLKTKEKARDVIGEQIVKNRKNYDSYLEILSQQLNINLEKGKENESLDKAIQKRNEEIKQLQDKIKKEGDSNGELQKSIEHLKTENSQINDLKTKLGDVNKNLDSQNSKYEIAEDNLSQVYGQAMKVGDETKSNVKQSEEYNRITGMDIKKDVTIKTSKDAEEENKKWSRPISKVINFLTRGKTPDAYAKGTNYHTGGPAFVGEEGPELVKMGGRMQLMDFGLYDLPVGAQVFTADETVNMLRNGLISGISQGVNAQRDGYQTSSGSNNKDVIRVLQEQNHLLARLLSKDTTINMDGQEVARLTEPYMSKFQFDNYNTRARSLGIR